MPPALPVVIDCSIGMNIRRMMGDQMPINVSWGDQDKKIVHCSVQGAWTNEDDAYTNAQVRILFDSLNRKAHVLMDFRRSHSLGGEALRKLLNFPEASPLFAHPNAGFLIFLKVPSDLQTSIATLASFDPRIAKRVKFVEDLEQAYALT